MPQTLTFTATVESYEDDIDLEDAPRKTVLLLINDNYDIPTDCIDSYEVK